MEATIKFDLLKEQNEFEICVHAMNWALTVWDLDQELRNKLKYGNEYKSVDEALQSTRDFLHEVLSEKNLTLDMIE